MERNQIERSPERLQIRPGPADGILPIRDVAFRSRPVSDTGVPMVEPIYHTSLRRGPEPPTDVASLPVDSRNISTFPEAHDSSSDGVQVDINTVSIPFSEDDDWELAVARSAWVNRAVYCSRSARSRDRKLGAFANRFFDIVETQYRQKLDDNGLSPEEIANRIADIKRREAAKIAGDIALSSILDAQERLSPKPQELPSSEIHESKVAHRPMHSFTNEYRRQKRRFITNWAQVPDPNSELPTWKRIRHRARGWIMDGSVAFLIAKASHAAANSIHSTEQGARLPVRVATSIVSGLWWAGISKIVTRNLAAGETNIPANPSNRRLQDIPTMDGLPSNHLLVAELRHDKMIQALESAAGKTGDSQRDDDLISAINDSVRKVSKENRHRLAASFILGAAAGFGYAEASALIQDQRG